MANTLTGLIPVIYDALDVVSNEPVGLLYGVNLDSKAEQAAVDQTVRSPVAAQDDLEDITAGANPADSGDTTTGYVDISISKSKAYPIRWTGEEQLSVKGSYRNIFRDQLAQGFRTLRNAIDADLASLYKKASRAYGTAGTAPFGTAGNLSDFAQMLKILEANGAPGDFQLVNGAAAMANLRGVQSVLFKVNEAGSDRLLREGVLGRVQGFDLRQSAEIDSHTKGTGTSYQTNLAATLAVGSTSIIIDTGSGTVLAGDVVTFAGDTNKYLVTSGVTEAGTITIAKPGLKQTLADDVAMTIGDSYTANMAFSRSAITLATRMPASPEGGDSADDRMSITDPVTGLTYELAMYRQYRRIKFEIGLAWGYAMIKPEHAAVLLG